MPRFSISGMIVLFEQKFPQERIRVLFMPKFPLKLRMDTLDVLSPLMFVSGVALLKVFPYPLAISWTWKAMVIKDLNWVMVSIIIFCFLIIVASLLHYPLTLSLCLGHKHMVEQHGFF